MSDVVYTAHVHLTRHGGARRTAQLPAGEEVAFGVHGAIAEHYGLAPGADATSTTLDYVVAAAGG